MGKSDAETVLFTPNLYFVYCERVKKRLEKQTRIKEKQLYPVKKQDIAIIS